MTNFLHKISIKNIEKLFLIKFHDLKNIIDANITLFLYDIYEQISHTW